MDKAREAFHERLLQEADASLEFSHSDIRAALQDELSDMFPGEYAYLRDVFGDSEEGECVYVCGNDTWKAPYEIGTVNGSEPARSTTTRRSKSFHTRSMTNRPT